ncbi:nucleoside triphosphate pyrophosphohydrolase [Lottiidibacillus patelloidae]|uniref:Nucleoside triphosphate pyrophosphohydrolase n=1 Tax=Lottiidibacillus patelloidae TaxID=2670334 RepID=A0A263BQI4_9BACI|nr:nucleoside triphosphate pyrophosphohydrolase [Lottiidibacillus patelloidae]OZM55838.1 nucleoside triphosphate pyrophosphohydrolase [Lottiidibacillus patelloidae]
MSKSIKIIGLGAGDEQQITLGTLRILKEAEALYLRTKEHPVVPYLETEGVHYCSYDNIYEENKAFEDVYATIAEKLLSEAETKDIVYAVPGHPMVAESTVQLLLEEGKKRGYKINIAGGQSFLDTLFTALKIDPNDGCQFVDGTVLKRNELQVRHHIIISQVYDAFIASEVKLTLMELLPDDYEVKIVTAAGSMEEKIETVKLHELDRAVTLSNLTSVYVPPVKKEEVLYRNFEFLRQTIATLRGPNGCPWDKEQTHETLKKYLIEESYEVLEAIDEQDDDHLIEELGDVLLQVLLHAQIGEDDGYFSIDDVIKNLSEKMIRRHPHVFADVKLQTEEQVVENWQKIKNREKKNASDYSHLSGVNKSLPGLLKAYAIQKKAAKVGFDWPNVVDAWEKVREEVTEFHEVFQQDYDKQVEEIGDLLFAIVNVTRFLKIDPEIAINSCIRKFEKRFHFIEENAKKSGVKLEDMSLEEMDNLWNQAKKR